MRRTAAQLLQQLGEAAEDPIGQAEIAVELLRRERRAQIVGPALRALAEYVPAAARTVLRELYRDLDRDGVHLDGGGDFRARILRILRPWLTLEDLPLLERAVTTYEYLPPGRDEVANAIRAAGLIALADLDPDSARFQAARLLVDVETSRFSGEPARTAASVLAAHSELTLLYLYSWQPEAVAEVLAECLRGLAGVPESILSELCRRFSTDAREAAQIGMIDLLTGSIQRATAQTELRRRLRCTTAPAVYRYLVITLAASRRKELIAELVAAAEDERDSGRLTALAEALALAAQDPQAAAAAELVRRRLRRRP
jgi:hypothetical protein